MEINTNQELIIKYLSKTYYIKNNTFFEWPEKEKYGRNIIASLNKIFNLDNNTCETTFKFWAHSLGFPDNEAIWRASYTPKRLRTTWNPEIIQDLQVFYGFNAEAEAINLLSQEILQEINAEILKTLVSSSTTAQDFLGIMRCEGYDLGPTLYDPMSFCPKKYFMSMTNNQIINERQTSIHWENFLRTPKSNSKT